jgi:hypothetical protein
MRIKKAFATGLLALTPALTGCLVHTRTVPKSHPPEVVMIATLDQLLKQTDDRYDALQSMTLTVQISTITGGSLRGEVKESVRFNGYIIIGKPDQIRTLLQLPIVSSKFLDMVSDGKTFKMVITAPTKNCAIVGSDVVTNRTQKGIYSLRPAVILDPLLIQGLKPNQIVSMTQDSRLIPDPKKRKELIEDPDYDLEFLSQPNGQVARSQRVIHIDRVNLLPWRQDIYNPDGKIATQAFYSDYKKFGDINFPTRIVIQRPLDELGLTITVTKANFNQKLAADQFKLAIPEGLPVTNMDDPVSAATTPCAARAPQSTH